jgi:hypothetical protein
MAGITAIEAAFSRVNHFLELPFDYLEKQPFSIYVLTYDSTFLYVNPVATAKLRGASILGNSIDFVTTNFPAFNLASTFSFLRYPLEIHKPVSIRSTVNGEMMDVNGFPLEDCYCISISEVIERHSLINELKTYLRKGRG